ncbi:hypothetical protein LSH36_366g01013 [Paralvinella palmiformis]|uniref:G-protein coupled receptors family 3 profile domain-containing protein n=1 Tax=Paralvinella palmiformis TaxID=53620 RepID=A0AAD9JFC3_9ANNE|nr:hypothetical protein LSH36_366g01013 [Paralvinella palmiformis]
MVEEAYRNKILNQSFGYDIGYQCHPCGRGCGPGCLNDTPCYVRYDVMIRGISVGVVSFCMSVCLILVTVIIRMRKTKVIIQYFEPSDLMCILVPWFREVGFVIVYGAVVLKLYRILTEFQSRKAHRVDVRDKDLLKYIFTIVLIVVGFLSAWTAVNLDYMIEDGATMVAEKRLPDSGLSTRTAPSDYKERRYLAIVIYNEAIVSTITHIIRNRAYSSSDVQDNALPESMKLHAGVNSNGDVDVAEINLSDMDPEEIRVIIKLNCRLYAG